MTTLFGLLLLISLVINGILVWYTRKIVQKLYYGVNNVDEIQKLLNEYANLLEPLLTMENYYADPAIASAISNTKMVAEACRAYKNSIIESPDEENQEIEKAEDIQRQEVIKTQAEITR